MRTQCAAALIMAIGLLSGCSNQKSELARSSVESSSAPVEASSQRAFDSAYTDVEAEFYLAWRGNPPAGDPLARWRQEGEARLAACGDAGCRHEVVSDLLNRLRFAQGEASDPVPGVPWSTGSFRFEGGGGALKLLPLGGERILVQVTTFESGQARWMCEGVLAEGQLEADGVAHLVTVHDERVRFLLHTSSPSRIELVPIEEELDRYHRLCGAGGTIFGHYGAVEPQ